MSGGARRYWDSLSSVYQQETRISCDDFHYGPLLPGDSELGLLPEVLTDCACLELGCGAGQNSIYLARQGATCVSVDISYGQLRHGLKLQARYGVDIRFVQCDLSRLPLDPTERFDLVHSAYALPFLSDQRAVIQAASRLLRRGGAFLLSTAHPLAAGEWLDVDDEDGVFTQNYFDPCADERTSGDGAVVHCRPVPLSILFTWLTENGLEVTDFLEPRPTNGHAPYDSVAWRDMKSQLERIPFAAVFKAVKR